MDFGGVSEEVLGRPLRELTALREQVVAVTSKDKKFTNAHLSDLESRLAQIATQAGHRSRNGEQPRTEDGPGSG